MLAPVGLLWSSVRSARLKARACITTLVMFSLALLACVPGGDGSRAQSLELSAAGQIAFASNRDGDFEIYVMDSDGSGVRRLTQLEGDDLAPAWSPDGTRIAFHSFRDGSSAIYVMDADGMNLRRLSADTEMLDKAPDWSPDGSQIVFSSAQILPPADASSSSTIGLYVLAYPERAVIGRRPRASAKLTDATSNIWVMDPDGGNRSPLTRDYGDDRAPNWSPAGGRIAFVSARGGNADIYVVDSDGTGLRQITENPQGDFEPAWSPDGRRLAFRASQRDDPDLYLVDRDGDGLRRLLTLPGVQGSPSWSFDGEWIVFDSFVAGEPGADIYAVRVDGSGLTRLTGGDDRSAFRNLTPSLFLTGVRAGVAAPPLP